MSNRRAYRVAQEIRSALARELFHAADPRFSLVTITSVMLSPDLKHAKIYWNAANANDDRIEEVRQAFHSAEGHFRSALAKGVKLRYIPKLKFYYDDTLDTVDEVRDLLQRVQPERE